MLVDTQELVSWAVCDWRGTVASPSFSSVVCAGAMPAVTISLPFIFALLACHPAGIKVITDGWKNLMPCANAWSVSNVAHYVGHFLREAKSREEVALMNGE